MYTSMHLSVYPFTYPSIHSPSVHFSDYTASYILIYCRTSLLILFLPGKCREANSNLSREEVYAQIVDHMVPVFGKPLPRAVFVLGGPGSGKGTQCANLVRDYGAYRGDGQTGGGGGRGC